MSWKAGFTVVLTTACLVAVPMSGALEAQGRGRGADRGGVDRGGAAARGRALNRRAPPRQLLRSQQEPAFARGYDDGYQDGAGDGRRGLRYDPADSRQYRDGDGGYVDAYGTRDAYRNNYRAGFRQGYEAGYRGATR